ncbi:MAG TPA: M56 and MltD domain-containing protein [Gammaproteobacteria bacterium]
MSSVAWANGYICTNVLLALTALLLRALDTVGGPLPRPIAYGHRLAVGNALLVAALVLPIAAQLCGDEPALPRTAQIWSAPSMNVGAADAPQDQRIAFSAASPGASLSLTAASEAAAGLVVAGLVVALFRLGRDFRGIRRIVSQAATVRRHGRLSIRVSERIDVPFSFWWPGRYLIVVPATLVMHAGDLRMALLHEVQHHRQHDTKWLYLYQLLEALFFWNPAVHRLERHLRALQEFACDEAVSARRSVSRSEYCRTLLRVAEAAASRRVAPLEAHMIDGGAARLLQRRVEAVLHRPERHQRKRTVLGVVAIAAALLAVAAVGCSSAIHDRRISPRDAAAMVAARPNDAIPIVVNDAVLRELNRLLATPDGRAYLHAAIERMRSYEALIASELARHALPAELLAVPLVESGYRNFRPDGDGSHGAGLWMLIEPTAKRFGLTVDATRDDRLDAAAETRAAMQLFAQLHDRFGDWGLAILAYNAGTARVEEGVRATGSRDVWRIIAAGYENDAGYVPRVMAAILVLENPSLLN